MFRSMTINREPALNLAKVIFMLKHSSLFMMRLCGSMLPHNHIINDIISLNVLT